MLEREVRKSENEPASKGLKSAQEPPLSSTSPTVWTCLCVALLVRLGTSLVLHPKSGMTFGYPFEPVPGHF